MRYDHLTEGGGLASVVEKAEIRADTAEPALHYNHCCSFNKIPFMGGEAFAAGHVDRHTTLETA